MEVEEEEKIKKALGRDNPKEFWLAEANNYFSELRDKTVGCTEALSIIENTFGKQWLEELLTAQPKRSPPFSDDHLLSGWIKVAGYNQVVSCLELAKYIKHTYIFPRFNDVITIMKDADQFETGFNQLAYAYRLAMVGCSNIEFEPPTDNGRVSDIQCEYKDLMYIVESYVPGNKGKPWYEDIINISAKKALEQAKAKNKRISLVIHIKCDEEQWNPTKRKHLESKIWSSIQNLALSEEKINETDFNLTIYDTTQMDDKDEEHLSQRVSRNSLCGTGLLEVSKDDLLHISRGQEVDKRSMGRAFLELDDLGDSIEKITERLATKLEKKIAQTRKGDAVGIMIVHQPYLGGDDQLKASLARIQGKLFSNHKKLSGVLVFRRAFKKGLLPYYHGNVLINKDENHELLHKLIEYEWGLFKI